MCVCVCVNLCVYELCVCAQQTDKTMTELEIDMNMRIGEWSVLQESDKQLKLVSGPGYTGMQNLGNR